MKGLRNKLKNELKGLNRKTIKLNLLQSIEYFYYSKIIQERNKGIKEIKNFIREVYIKVGEYNKKDE